MNRRLPTMILLPLLAATMLGGCSDSTTFDRAGTAAALANIIATEQDHVTVAELADWIIKDRRDFIVLDIRDAEDYGGGHIEGARHVPLAALMSDASLEALPAGGKIVVYSNGTAHAAQAALLLRLIERDAYALLGGFNYWQAYMHDPKAAGAAEMDPAKRAEYAAVACRFAGEYVGTAGLPVQAPAPLAPAAPVAADPLGLGLGLGTDAVRTVPAPSAPEPARHDPLGLGLDLGLGTDAVKDTTPAQSPAPQKKLLIKAEC